MWYLELTERREHDIFDETSVLSATLTIYNLCLTFLLHVPSESVEQTCGVGVDLSSRMVEKAIEREVYDAVHCADLVAFLRRQKAESCDLLVATDVVMYLSLG